MPPNKSLRWPPEPYLSRFLQGLYFLYGNNRARHLAPVS